ncbi:hypothetical protein [Actinoplanes sp. DH11]|nr:hypothetical protein [Actinoplanes sp. DH11]
METMWMLLVGLLSVAGLFAAMLVAGLLWAYTPLLTPSARRRARPVRNR